MYKLASIAWVYLLSSLIMYILFGLVSWEWLISNWAVYSRVVWVIFSCILTVVLFDQKIFRN